jgi:hypothetical protein
MLGEDPNGPSRPSSFMEEKTALTFRNDMKPSRK